MSITIRQPPSGKANATGHAEGEKPTEIKKKTAPEQTEALSSVRATGAPTTDKFGGAVVQPPLVIVDPLPTGDPTPPDSHNRAGVVFTNLASVVESGPPPSGDVSPSGAGDPNPDATREGGLDLAQVFTDFAHQLVGALDHGDEKITDKLTKLLTDLFTKTNGLTPPPAGTSQAMMMQILWSPALAAALKPIIQKLAAGATGGATLSASAVSIPPADIHALEDAMKSPVALFGKLSKGLEHVSPEQLKAAFEAFKSGNTEGIDPALLALVKEAAAFAGMKPGTPVAGPTPQATQAGGGTQLQTVNLKGVMMEGTAAAGGINFATGDVETLLMIVMNQSEQLESNILRDAMKDMQAMNMKKQAQRQKLAAMKEMSAKLESQMRNEFGQLQASGEVASTVTFDQYKAFRQVAWGDGDTKADGTWQGPQPGLPPLPSPLPSWLVTGAAPAVSDSGNTGVDNGFGLSAIQVNYFKTLFDSLPADERNNYANDVNEWLKKKGLKLPANSIDDAIANQQKAKEIADAAKTTQARQRSVDEMAGELFKLGLAVPYTSAAVEQKIELLLEQVTVHRMMIDVTPALPNRADLVARWETEDAGLKKILGLAHELEPVDQQALSTYMTGTGPGDFAGQIDQFKRTASGIGSWMENVQNNADAMSQTVDKGGDNHIYNMDTYWSGGTVHASYEYRWGSSSAHDSEPDAQWGASAANNFLKTGDAGVALGAVPQFDAPFGDIVSGHWEFDQLKSLGSAAAGNPYTFAPEAEAGAGPTDEAYGLAFGPDSDMSQTLALLNEAKNLPKNTLGEPYDDGSINHDKLMGLVDAGYLKLGKTPDELQAAADKATQAKEKSQDFFDAGSGAMALNHIGSLGELTAATDKCQTDMDSLSEMSNLASMRLQAITERRSKLLEMMSNLMKKFDQTSDLIAGNTK